MGGDFRVTADRGKFFEGPWSRCLMATVHPSSPLRITEEAERRSEYERFVADLRGVAEKLNGPRLVARP
jgi:hypothetical protein